MQKERILALADLIEKQPYVDRNARDGFNMGVYNHPCGSPSCISGWAIFQYAAGNKSDLRGSLNRGAEILGLNKITAEKLFDPAAFTDDFGVFLNDEITPSQAAATLRHLAETGEVDWTVGGVK